MMDWNNRFVKLISPQGEVNLVPPMLISRFSNLEINPMDNSIKDNNMLFSSFLIMGDVVDIQCQRGKYFLKIDDGTGLMEMMMISSDEEKQQYLYETSKINPEDYLMNLVKLVREEMTNTCPPVSSLKIGDCLLIHAQISSKKNEDECKISAFKFHRMPKLNVTEKKYDWYFSCLNYYLKKMNKP